MAGGQCTSCGLVLTIIWGKDPGYLEDNVLSETAIVSWDSKVTTLKKVASFPLGYWVSVPVLLH